MGGHATRVFPTSTHRIRTRGLPQGQERVGGRRGRQQGGGSRRAAGPMRNPDWTTKADKCGGACEKERSFERGLHGESSSNVSVLGDMMWISLVSILITQAMQFLVLKIRNLPVVTTRSGTGKSCQVCPPDLD
jgi:hypothetical protein